MLRHISQFLSHFIADKNTTHQKTDLFNLFASQCTIFANNSGIPDIQSYKTNSRLSSLSFENDDILKLIKSRNMQKAHGPDDISIRTIKVCDSALVKSLSLIFQNCLNCSTFPNIWKKSNIYPIHKKNDKHLFHYCVYLGKYLKNLFLNLFLSIVMNTNCSQNINLVSDKIIHAQINYCLLFMTYIPLSMLILLLNSRCVSKHVKSFC